MSIERDFNAWHKRALSDCRVGNAGVPGWMMHPETARQIHAGMVASERAVAAQRENSEIAALRAEVAQLRAALGRLQKLYDASVRNANGMFGCLSDVLFGKGEGSKEGILDRVIDRIVALEKRQADSVTLPSSADIAAATRAGPAVHDAGIWSTARWYHAGDLVTHHNASWIATIKSRGQKPGDGAAWRLIHKTEQAHVRRLVREELTARAAKGTR
jgi:hypothetical protein